jgi:hypothetical protein
VISIETPSPISPDGGNLFCHGGCGEVIEGVCCKGFSSTKEGVEPICHFSPLLFVLYFLFNSISEDVKLKLHKELHTYTELTTNYIALYLYVPYERKEL